MSTVEEDDELLRIEDAIEAAVIARMDAEERYGKGSPEHRAALAAQDAAGEELTAFYGRIFDAADAGLAERWEQAGRAA